MGLALARLICFGLFVPLWIPVAAAYPGHESTDSPPILDGYDSDDVQWEIALADQLLDNSTQRVIARSNATHSDPVHDIEH
ncbi:hypothetical protein QBC47DRAFT_397709 [Echria macrotheca]|uniref:Secreted protein n=1 Tax=Echria macrotheca TaxID=438768 RepID=A0AAJ0BL61_9PEZI|nr:hypothetical protein QBC47DRAFT_397709 [Echria macrotheca]